MDEWQWSTCREQGFILLDHSDRSDLHNRDRLQPIWREPISWKGDLLLLDMSKFTMWLLTKQRWLVWQMEQQGLGLELYVELGKTML